MGKTSFTLEEYESFLENPFMANFSIDQLNQVIFMHGFSRIWRRPKIELLNVLSTIELVRPYRSTLEEEDYVNGGGELFGRAGDFSPSNDQVKRDLEALNWQECQVLGVETVGLAPAAAKNSSGATSSRKFRGGGAVSVPPKDLLVSPIKRRRRSRKRKWRNLDSIDGGSSVAGEDNYFHGGHEEREGTDIPSAAAVGGAEAAVGSASLYVDTYHWEL
ncbi:unnamed protein product [Linum trigynum]|uniref:DUF7787 domain-containing protein n=1 Tax=Linum trigynum TaxID=586398 RepID=A0AAV2FGM0_9ROSI